MNLDEVNAILVWKDGEPHSFGDKKMLTPDELDESNYHDFSFMQEIYPDSWFKDTGYPYNDTIPFSNQMEMMTAYGFTIICNTSSRVTGQEDYYCYLVYVPENMSDNVKEYLESIYDSFKGLIDEHHALFQAVVINETGGYGSQFMFYLDDLYDKLGLNKGKSVSK